MEETTEKSVWNKTQDELTFGDSVKINIAALGGIVVIGGVVVGGLVAVEKFQNWRRDRKKNKLTVVK